MAKFQEREKCAVRFVNKLIVNLSCRTKNLVLYHFLSGKEISKQNFDFIRGSKKFFIRGKKNYFVQNF